MIERIFIDASYTLASGKNSGIERVVRSILRESVRMGMAQAIPAPKVVLSIGGEFYAPSQEQQDYFSKPAAMHANVLSTMPSAYVRLAKGVCRVTGSDKLQKWLLPQAGHLGLFKLAHNFYETRVRRKIAATCEPLRFGPGDLILLPDAYWVNRLRTSMWPATSKARAQGSLIATLLYDLIPLTHPEFVGLKRRDAFLEYLKQVAQHSDLMLAISDTVRSEVTNFLPTVAETSSNFCDDIRSFQLGAELENATGPIRGDVIDLFGSHVPPYLMVATFDPRKNHQYLMDAFDLLWREQPSLKLCLVGRIGSRCEEIVRRITDHPQLGKQLFLFSDLSDAELHHCYTGARGVIFPSIVEGFGLPIVESLWFGKKTFVSDTPIHREVGQNDCCYFSLDSPNSLAKELLAWEAAVARNEQPALPTRKLVSWRESTQQVLQHCLQAAQLRQASAQPLRKVA